MKIMTNKKNINTKIKLAHKDIGKLFRDYIDLLRLSCDIQVPKKLLKLFDDECIEILNKRFDGTQHYYEVIDAE